MFFQYSFFANPQRIFCTFAYTVTNCLCQIQIGEWEVILDLYCLVVLAVNFPEKLA